MPIPDSSRSSGGKGLWGPGELRANSSTTPCDSADPAGAALFSCNAALYRVHGYPELTGQSGLKYRREIDGLRAVAVLPVILFHAGFTAFGGGYIGVDIFFVISGYLITTILISDREAGTYSLWRFYERRARRILPALFLVLACCVPFAWMWIPPDPLEDFARSLGFTVLFISNVHFLEH